MGSGPLRERVLGRAEVWVGPRGRLVGPRGRLVGPSAGKGKERRGLGLRVGLLGWSLGRVGLVFWFDFLFWAGLSLDMGFLFFFSSSISISKSNQTI